MTDVDGGYQIVRAPVAGVIEASQAEEVAACGIHLSHVRQNSLSAKDHATPRPASMCLKKICLIWDEVLAAKTWLVVFATLGMHIHLTLLGIQWH